MYQYLIYDLNIESEIKLGGIPETQFDQADVCVKFGRIENEELGFKLNIGGVARYQIIDGQTIIIEPTDDLSILEKEFPSQTTDAETLKAFHLNTIKTFLMGSAIGTLLHQRKLLVLHGNSIQTDKGCLIFVAHSGTGKSTTAAAFLKNGYKILSDDVCPIDCSGDAPKVVPGYPQIKLWKDAIEGLGYSHEGLEPVNPDFEKYLFPTMQHYCSTPQKICAVIELSIGEEFHLEKIKGFEKFNLLKEHTYRDNVLHPLGMLPEHLHACSLISNKTSLYKMTRPKEPFTAENLVKYIEKELEVNKIATESATLEA